MAVEAKKTKTVKASVWLDSGTTTEPYSLHVKIGEYVTPTNLSGYRPDPTSWLRPDKKYQAVVTLEENPYIPFKIREVAIPRVGVYTNVM